LLLFSECVCPILGRTFIRNTFEELVVSDVKQQLEKTGKTTLSYVNIGSGRLFQDLVLLTKLLHFNPTIKKVNVQLYDTTYNEMVEFGTNSTEGFPTIKPYLTSTLKALLQKMFPEVTFSIELSNVVAKFDFPEDVLGLVVGIDLLGQGTSAWKHPFSIVKAPTDFSNKIKHMNLLPNQLTKIHLFPESLTSVGSLNKSIRFDRLLTNSAVWLMDKFSDGGGVWHAEIWRRTPATNKDDLNLTTKYATIYSPDKKYTLSNRTFELAEKPSL
jgi:hypothetical protein